MIVENNNKYLEDGTWQKEAVVWSPAEEWRLPIHNTLSLSLWGTKQEIYTHEYTLWFCAIVFSKLRILLNF